MFYKLFNRWLQIPGSRYIRLLSLSLSWFLRLVISSHDFSIASSLLISRKFLGRTIQNVIKKWLRNGLISLLTIDLNTRATIIYQTRYWECIRSLIVFHRKRSCLQTSTAVSFLPKLHVETFLTLIRLRNDISCFRLTIAHQTQVLYSESRVPFLRFRNCSHSQFIIITVVRLILKYSTW